MRFGGPHAGFGLTEGVVARYLPEFAPFAAVGSPEDLAALTAFVPSGAVVVTFTAAPFDAPPGLAILGGGTGNQMVVEAVRPVESALPIRDLGKPDLPAILELVALTEPGPFSHRTIELGRYIGITDGGGLIAMAGERMHPAGFTEISAVCTHPDFRGRGFAKALVSEVALGILARGETPFLHVKAENEAAIATYEKLGFVLRHRMTVTALRHAAGS